MLTAPRGGFYFRGGLVIAGLGVFALIAPPAVSAFGHGRNALYCLTHHHNGITKPDSHSRSAQHQGENDAASAKASPGRGDHKATCCALVLVTALAPNTEAILCLTWPGRTPHCAPETRYSGRWPDRLMRPPISSLSV